MKSSAPYLAKRLVAVCAIAAVFMLPSAAAQTKSFERSFPQSKAEMEKALAKLQASMSGHLPALEGFAQAGDHPLDQYRRGFYQSTVLVTEAPNGGSIVRITTKVTAWYSDPAATRSGYQLLVSNGRIESDLLDQLADQFVSDTKDSNTVVAAAANAPRAAAPVTPSTNTANHSDQPAAPSRQFPRASETPSSSMSQGLASSLDHSADNAKENEKHLAAPSSALQAEIANLEEVLKNQGHPKNLVAVKKSGTPVVESPSLTAKPEFLASQHDEFELLNFTADWVHVRISGLSRGWIWRNSVEMPEGIPDTKAAPATAMTPVADQFRVTREETAQFPGDWEPLRSKNVKILTVQKVDETAATAGSKDDGPKQRLDYTKFLLDKSYGEVAANPQGLAGIVVIFDSTDGGMIAAPLVTLQQWKAGSLTDAALWHKCFFDPPELLDSAAAAGGQ